MGSSFSYGSSNCPGMTSWPSPLSPLGRPRWAPCAGAANPDPGDHHTLPGSGSLWPGTFQWSPKLPICEHTLDHTLWTNTRLSRSLANHPCQCPHVPTCQRRPMAERKHRLWGWADLCVNFVRHFLDGWSSGSHFTYQSLYFFIYQKPKYQSCQDSKRMKQD